MYKSGAEISGATTGSQTPLSKKPQADLYRQVRPFGFNAAAHELALLTGPLLVDWRFSPNAQPAIAATELAEVPVEEIDIPAEAPFGYYPRPDPFSRMVGYRALQETAFIVSAAGNPNFWLSADGGKTPFNDY